MILPILKKKNVKVIVVFFTSTVLFFLTIRQTATTIDFKTMSFDNFNNETGADYFVVPNIIHQVRFNQTNFTFVEYICLMSAFRNQRPDLLYIHTNIKDGNFNGKYWQWVKKNVHIFSRIRIKYLQVPTQIFGQPLNFEGNGLWHASDISRLRILMEYGGIYMDNDAYIVQNLDKYRKFEATINWDEGSIICNSFFMASQNARILPLWLSTYQDYRSDLWYYNGGALPTRLILNHYPELVHRVQKRLIMDGHISMNLLTERHFDWRRMDGINLCVRCPGTGDPGFKNFGDFDEKTIQNFSLPFGEMVREVLAFQ